MKLPAISALASATLLASTAFAGQSFDAATDGKKTVVEPCTPTSRILFDIDSSYVFESDFDSGSHPDAKGDAYSGSVAFGYRIPLGNSWPNEKCGEWNLRLGAYYARHDFGNSGGLPLPNHIQTLAGVIALEYVVNNEVGIIFETRPGVYFENDIAGRNFDSPAFVAFAIRFSPNFIGAVGATYGSFRTYPILPGIGFKWTISDKLTLSALFPKATLDYKFSEACGMYIGGEYVGDAVRVDNAKGRPDDLNHAVLQYSEYRAGAGVRFKIGALSGEIGAGYAFQRSFNYHRAERIWETEEGAPYIKAELHAAF